MDERKLFDADNDFRRATEQAKLNQKKRARLRGIDEQIAEAEARGDFKDLPGKGKPLIWDTGRDDDSWLANHVLKNAGFTPGWIEDAKHIQAERRILADQLRSMERWLREIGVEQGDDGALRADVSIETSLRRQIGEWRERAEKLNRVIDRYNLEVPNLERQVMRVRIDTELAGLEGRA